MYILTDQRDQISHKLKQGPGVSPRGCRVLLGKPGFYQERRHQPGDVLSERNEVVPNPRLHTNIHTWSTRANSMEQQEMQNATWIRGRGMNKN